MTDTDPARITKEQHAWLARRIGELQRENDSLRADAFERLQSPHSWESLMAAILRVRELHAPRPLAEAEHLPLGFSQSQRSTTPVCSECAAWESEFGVVLMPYPCPTIRALAA